MEQINMSELSPIIQEVISTGSSFRLYPKGTSMLPSIVEGQDSVVLSKPEKLQVMDAVLYKRKSGQYVLHRIVSKNKYGYVMCGDNQVNTEKYITPDMIIAKVTGIYKKDAYIDVSLPNYKRKIKKLYRNKSIRKVIYSIKTFIYPVYKAIFK